MRKAFTLIELLVVIAIIAILLAIVVPALGKAKELAKNIICKNHVKQQCMGTILYAEENGGRVPTTNSGYWFWDVSFWATNEISREAGIDYKVFFCPSNRLKKSEDARYWQYSWVYSWGVNLMQPQQLRNESVLTPDQQRAQYRVLPYIYMFDRYTQDAAGNIVSRMYRDFPTLLTGEDAVWITKLPEVRNSGATIMIMDAVISDAADNQNFSDIRTGGAYPNFGIADSTNHLSKRRSASTATTSFLPKGGNIGFVDGHVDWRKFESMQHRLTFGQWFWW